jgi:hypothetical protein
MRITFRLAGRCAAAGTLCVGGVLSVADAVAPTGGIVPTTLRDFKLPGSQPGPLVDDIQPGFSCAACHGYYDEQVAPYDLWQASMMAQSARDPIFHAALAIAEQDADFAGDMCLRCHTPAAWLAGRAFPTDGSGLDNNLDDFDGINCHFCHRLVDPIAASENPIEDVNILAALSDPPGDDAHTGQYVVDPEDLRRGPFDLGSGFGFHEWRQSPYHQDAQLCATCHDVSNPVLIKRDTGVGYKIDTLNQEHSTQRRDDYFPLERTFSEWMNSVYAVAPIETNGRFGGQKTAVQTCQDCHMPDADDTACLPGMGQQRPDMPLHHFNGANSWVLKAVRATYPDFETGLDDTLVNNALARNVAMLQSAADLSGSVLNGELVVRVVNQTGHKLPTGYGEGRRMWLHVVFRDAGNNIVAEHGHYDAPTADLATSGTRVYEVEHGLDGHMSAQTGLPVGPSFHFVLNNKIFKDNRIPARGFARDVYAAAGAPVVGAHYSDQQYWDDVAFTLPAGAVTAEVELLHQTTSKEYIEFLRDENTTNATGQDVYDLWEFFGKSLPVLMQSTTIALTTTDCLDPVPFALGKESSLGTYPELRALGSPSLAAGTFDLEVSGGVPGQMATVFWGMQMASAPHFGGVLLVSNPHRGPSFTLDAQGAGSTSIAVPPALVGAKRAYQVLFRDPADAYGVGMTNGVLVTFCD